MSSPLQELSNKLDSGLALIEMLIKIRVLAEDPVVSEESFIRMKKISPTRHLLEFDTPELVVLWMTLAGVILSVDSANERERRKVLEEGLNWQTLSPSSVRDIMRKLTAALNTDFDGLTQATCPCFNCVKTTLPKEG